MLQRVNLAVEYWGYANIYPGFCRKHEIDLEAHAKNQGWFLLHGKMVHTITKLPPVKETAYEDIINLPIGETKAAIKQKVKEAKKKAKITQPLPAKLTFK